MITTSETLLALLGKPLASSGVNQTLVELGLVPAPALALERGAIDVSARDLGLDITFKRAERLRDAQSLAVPPDCLVVAVIFFHAPGFEGYSGYSGMLPYGLQFTHSRSAVRALLGAPSGSSTRYKNDRWNWDPLYQTIDFADDEQSIDLVTVGLPWRPRSTAPFPT